MTISTRGRYALRVMIHLAENDNGEYISLRSIAERQGLSVKYLERILSALSDAGIVEGRHGKGGGYRLMRAPSDISVLEVLKISEGDTAPVSCLECDAVPCERAGECRTVEMWRGYQRLTDEYFGNITISSLVH